MLLRRAQVGTSDLFAGLFIFIIVGSILFLAWNNYSATLIEKVNYKDLSLKTAQISDLLIKGPGSPSAWESGGTIQGLGLANKPNKISQAKIISFIDSDFITDFEIKALLNIELYNFSIVMTDSSGTQLFEGPDEIKRGLIPNGKKNVVSMERFVIYKNEPAKIQVKLWEK